MTEYEIRCKCHHEIVEVVPNKETSRNDYLCPITKRVIYAFIHTPKEVNMAKKKNPGKETMEQLPEEEETGIIEEPFFPEEEAEFSEEELPEEKAEEEKEPEQQSLFEGDKVYNVLHTALTDVNEELKKVDKQIDSKKLDKSVLINKKEELQEAIKIYEEQRKE